MTAPHSQNFGMKKADLNSKVGKYFLARNKGLNKSKAALEAGYASPTHTTRTEETQSYQNLVLCYKDELLKHITLEEIAEVQAKTIRQERDLGARNTAIKEALHR
ncbi:MAG: hypothetical protein WAW81_00480, partial [Minisyncoccia bacterium]